MNTQSAPSTSDIWAVISKEITGIQLLWTAVEQLYFKGASDRGIASLEQETPVLYRLMQTSMMESLLMRISRLMDKPKSNGQSNLSLAQLTSTDPGLVAAASAVRKAWDATTLIDIRNKYVSHNDLVRSLTEQHTLNIPLSVGDVEAVRDLAARLRSFRRVVSQKVSGAAYSDETLDRQMSYEIDVLDRTMLAGDCFYRLLPEHAFLQQALAVIEADAAKRMNPET